MYQRVRGGSSGGSGGSGGFAPRASVVVGIDADVVVESGSDEAQHEIHILDSSDDDENEEGLSLELPTVDKLSSDFDREAKNSLFSFTSAQDNLFGRQDDLLDSSNLSLSRKGKDIVQVVVADDSHGGVGED